MVFLHAKKIIDAFYIVDYSMFAAAHFP